MTLIHRYFGVIAVLGAALSPVLAQAQNASPEPEVRAVAGPSRKTIVKKNISFDASQSVVPEGTPIQEIFWDFGDGIKTTGDKVTHAYSRPGTYTVRMQLTAGDRAYSDSSEIQIFSRVMVLIADNSISDDQLNALTQQAAEEKLLLLPLKAKSNSPEALTEEELTTLLVNDREEVSQADIIASWTAGATGINVLSKFAQYVKQADEQSFKDLNLDAKGLVFFTDTPFAVLAPAAQSLFDQLRPDYIMLTRSAAISLIFSGQTAEDARANIVASQIDHRLLGAFSGRAIRNLNLTNFLSYGVNFLVNHGVPINNIVLILMIPVIATILSFARQVIGIKAFGLITPAMTTLSFLVMGLYTGLIVFIVVLLSGTLTRLLLRRLRLLYLPRMALVLTNVSLSILVLLGISAATGRIATLSFSVFPILILTLLAEEFIAVQFTRGVRTALRVTAWTLLLVIICYYIVSWQILRTLLLSYPEIVLLAIPINILLGRFSGLRVVEYIRFRELMRYGGPPE